LALRACEWLDWRRPNGRLKARDREFRLALNELRRTLGGLKRMRSRSAAAAEEIRTLGVYLAGQSERFDCQSERFDCDELRRRGLPRGSGGIKSANKLHGHADCHVP